MGKLRVQLLGLAGAEVCASVLVTTDREGVIRPMYLFNTPEGLARAALEHKVTLCPRLKYSLLSAAVQLLAHICLPNGLTKQLRDSGAAAIAW